MRPTSAHPDLQRNGTSLKQVSLNNRQATRPSSGYTSRNRVLKSNETAYHTWLRRSNEFDYNIRKYPRDYKSVQTFNLRSGCQLMKSPSLLQVKINPDEFFEPKQQQTIESHMPVRDMELLIQNLREQVQCLTVYLEEERLHHAGTKKRAKMDVEKAKAEMEKVHDAEVERMLQSHIEFTEELKKEHAQQLEELEDELKAQYRKLEKEYKLLQASFKNFRTKISREMDEKWNERKREFDWEKQRAVDNATANAKKTMEEKFNKERISIRSEYKELMEQMVGDQRKEMEEFMRKMSDGKSSIEELKARADEADRLELELNETIKQLQASKTDVKNLTHDLNETKVLLSVYENKFEEKVEAVEDKYRQKIDDLVNEVADFRVLLIRKAEMMYTERAAADDLQKRWTQFAKEKLEERLFGMKEAVPKSVTNASAGVNNAPNTDKKQGEHCQKDSEISNFHCSSESLDRDTAKSESAGLANGIYVPMSTRRAPERESPQLFALPPKKHVKIKVDDHLDTEKDISATKAGKDKIRPRLPMTTICLLETADLPFVDDADVSSAHGSSRPHSPSVIY